MIKPPAAVSVPVLRRFCCGEQFFFQHPPAPFDGGKFFAGMRCRRHIFSFPRARRRFLHWKCPETLRIFRVCPRGRFHVPLRTECAFDGAETSVGADSAICLKKFLIDLKNIFGKTPAFSRLVLHFWKFCAILFPSS